MAIFRGNWTKALSMVLNGLLFSDEQLMEEFRHILVFRDSFNPGGKYGTEWNKDGYQLSFDFHLGGVKVVPAFYLQYYEGYAETLLNYNEKVNEFRAGFMF